MLCTNKFDKNATQCSDGNVDQVAHRQSGCLEVNSNHCSDLEIDKQQQKVPQFGPSSMNHAEESPDGRPHCCCTEREQRQIVKGIDQKRSECVREASQLCMKSGGEAV